ncbi:MAG: SurA N-terminal domain-containing protein [Tepidiformaceae bacterium]
MARRERTTGLPRPRVRAEHVKGKRVAGVRWGEQHVRLAIIAGAIALLLLVTGLLGYRYYDNNYATPRHVVLTVGGQKTSLSYYTERLYQFAQANSANQSQGSTSLALLEQQLLTKLEEESLTVQLAKSKGIDLSDDAITKEIATELGVPVGGPGSSFDTLYRAKLSSTKLSDGNYRRLAEATLANNALLDQFKSAVGDTGEGVTLRAVVAASQGDAQKALDQIKGGQDMGTVAQTVSTDLTSKQNDGVMLPEAPELLPANVQTAIKDKPAGADLYGPVQVETNWWVFRIDNRDPAFTYSDAEKTQLAQAHLDAAIKDERAKTTIKHNLTSDDLTWAVKNAG